MRRVDKKERENKNELIGEKDARNEVARWKEMIEMKEGSWFVRKITVLRQDRASITENNNKQATMKKRWAINNHHHDATSFLAKHLYPPTFLSNELSPLFLQSSQLLALRTAAALFSSQSSRKRAYIFKSNDFTKFSLVHCSFSFMRLPVLET